MAHVETDNFFMGKIKNPKNNVCDVILQTCKVKTVSFTNQKSNLKDSNNMLPLPVIRFNGSFTSMRDIKSLNAMNKASQ